MASMLMSQWDSLMCELFSKNFLDAQFKEVEMLEDTTTNFVTELVNVYCEANDTTINKLMALFNQPTKDCQKIRAHIDNLIGSSASLGACRVKNSAKQLYNFWKERDIEGCNRALEVVRAEFSDTRAKLKEMVELKQKILHLLNPKKK